MYQKQGKSSVYLNKRNQQILEYLIKQNDLGLLNGSFTDIPPEVYHHPLCPGWSSSEIWKIHSESFEHYEEYLESIRTPKKAFQFGTWFHCYSTEPDEFIKSYKISTATTRKQKEFRDDMGRYLDQDVVLLTATEFDLLRAMDEKLKNHPEVKRVFDGADFEITFWARCPQTGILRKCRADIWNPKLNVVADLKTCRSAAYYEFKRDVRTFGYRFKACYYLSIISDCMNTTLDNFTWIACEKERPFAVQPYRCNPITLIDEEENILETLGKIKNFNGFKGIEEGVPEL